MMFQSVHLAGIYYFLFQTSYGRKIKKKYRNIERKFILHILSTFLEHKPPMSYFLYFLNAESVSTMQNFQIMAEKYFWPNIKLL